MTVIKDRTPESIDVSADWLNKRAAIFRNNGQTLSAEKAEAKAHRLFVEANELRKTRREFEQNGHASAMLSEVA